MSEKKKVGDKLNLKLSLTDGNESKFVRAYLRNQIGTPLAPAQVDLPHIEKGVYGESTLAMPNEPQVFVVYRIFQDPARTILDQNYSQALDTFTRDDLDIMRLVPVPYAVMAEFESSDPEVIVESNEIQTIIENDNAVDAIVFQGEVNALFEQNEEIEGVLND